MKLEDFLKHLGGEDLTTITIEYHDRDILRGLYKKQIVKQEVYQEIKDCDIQFFMVCHNSDIGCDLHVTLR